MKVTQWGHTHNPALNLPPVPGTDELDARRLLAMPWAMARCWEPAWQEGGELAVPSMSGVSTLVGALPRLWVQHPHPRFPPEQPLGGGSPILSTSCLPSP